MSYNNHPSFVWGYRSITCDESDYYTCEGCSARRVTEEGCPECDIQCPECCEWILKSDLRCYSCGFVPHWDEEELSA